MDLTRRWNDLECFIWWMISNPIKISLSGRWEPMTFVQITKFGKIWIPMGFLVINVVVKSFPLTALKFSSKCCQDWDGIMFGLIILLWAPVSRSPMVGIGLWNFESKMWSFMEGIGMVVSRDKSCWWKTVWNSSFSESSDEFCSANIVSSVGSSCSEKNDSISSVWGE